MGTVTLHIALHDGFDDDEVEVHVGGRSVWRAAGLRTRTQIGLAHEAEIDLPPGTHTVVVHVPTRGTSATATIPVDGPTWLGVSLGRDGAISLEPSEQPFHYA